MEKRMRSICGWVYDEAVEGVKFEDQPADYVYPICGVKETNSKNVIDLPKRLS